MLEAAKIEHRTLIELTHHQMNLNQLSSSHRLQQLSPVCKKEDYPIIPNKHTDPIQGLLTTKDYEHEKKI